jgi:hypothetical protein
MHTTLFIRIFQNSITKRIQGSTQSQLTSNRCRNTYKLDEGGCHVEAVCPDLTPTRHLI